MRIGPLLATAMATATLDGLVQGARLATARQGWQLTEVAPALGLEFALALGVASLVLALAGWTDRRAVVLAAAAGTAAALVAAAPAFPQVELAPPATGVGPGGGASTVVLLTLDTLRRDHVSAYDDALVPGLTPRLESLAAAALRFDDAVTTAPLTLPSHTTLLTGLAPDQHGVVRNGRAVPDRLDSAPRRFAGAGYATGAFVSTSVLHGSHGMARWFDVYRDELGAPAGAMRLPLARLVPGVSPPSRLVKEPGDRTIERALAWLGRQAETPAFLWVHLYDAHGPHSDRGPATAVATVPDPCLWAGHPTTYRAGPRAGAVLPGAPPGACGTNTQRRVERFAASYAAEVAHVDALVGRLIDGLQGLGRWADTGLVVVADHGESISEHNQWGSHEYSLYEPVVRVPLIVRVPQGEAAAVREQVSTVRVAATLLALGGLEPGPAMAGPDLRIDAGARPTAIVGPSPLGRPPGDRAAKGATGLQIAIRLPPLKSLVDAGGYIERYELTSDPLERTPQLTAAERHTLRGLPYAAHRLPRPGILPLPGWRPPPPARRRGPGEVKSADVTAWGPVDSLATSLLTGWTDRPAGGTESDPAELPADVLEALRSLGYVDL